MGEVYQAYDRRLQRRVAIKHVRSGTMAERTSAATASRESFLREARAAAGLNHPSIVQIHDVLENWEGAWIVMERVDGPTVAQLVAQAQGPLPVELAVTIGRQVAEGLVAAHKQGILHRDLKSENVMLGHCGRAKILDFGIAKRLGLGEAEASLSLDGQVWGTCHTMSPEQARGQRLDARSDLFALGVLLYEMLTGKSPFLDKTPVDTLARVCHHDPAPVVEVNSEVPGELSVLVGGLLKKERELRLSEASEVVKALLEMDATVSKSDSAKNSLVAGPIPIRKDIRLSVARLPTTAYLLLGRDDQLTRLTAAWDSETTHILSIVAPGGVGKTALVNRWLGEMAQEGYRGARLVFGWSFFSQGAGESKNASGESFIDAALEWFGDPNPTAGSPWQRGERLADLVGRERTLLILDGLEPLQEPPRTGLPTGRLKDPGLQALLRNLAASNNGLCLITSREQVEDLDSKVGTTVERLDLRELTPETGASVLRAYDLKAPEVELREISEAFGGHALALTLLATYLRDVCDGDVRRWREVPILDEDAEQGGHAFRVMQSYEEWLGQGAAVAVLYLLGLFDRPAGKAEIDALLEEPAIPGLTDTLVKAGSAGWKRAIARLRDARLASDRGGPGEAGGLDAHPLIRAYFGNRLKETNEPAYQAGHLRLYEHFKEVAPEFPETLDERQPLYQAIHHGCRAGKVKEALHEVYIRRIHREDDNFYPKKLGAFGSELAALSGFFECPWDRPAPTLSEGGQGRILNDAGFNLRALGRVAEAVAPMREGVKICVGQKDWVAASVPAVNLSELLLTLGQVEEAVAAARESVELAERGGERFMRMVNRTTLADTLHQAGRVEEARVLFEEAEAIQAERRPEYPRLYSVQGFRYYDLLLTLSSVAGYEGLEAIRRQAEETLDWMENDLPQMDLLSIALGHLTLGRTHLALARTAGSPETEPARTTNHLDSAVDGLRGAGTMHYLPLGLLARAAMHRLIADPEAATRDLDEAFEIADRGGMRLHLTDAYLERARLRLARGQIDKAREDLEAARKLVAETGYHRRYPEVAALAAQLGR